MKHLKARVRPAKAGLDFVLFSWGREGVSYTLQYVDGVLGIHQSGSWVNRFIPLSKG